MLNVERIAEGPPFPPSITEERARGILRGEITDLMGWAKDSPEGGSHILLLINSSSRTTVGGHSPSWANLIDGKIAQDALTGVMREFGVDLKKFKQRRVGGEIRTTWKGIEGLSFESRTPDHDSPTYLSWDSHYKNPQLRSPKRH